MFKEEIKSVIIEEQNLENEEASKLKKWPF